MNPALFLLVFLSGVFMAMFLGGLFGDYFKACLKTGSGRHPGYLPDESYIQACLKTGSGRHPGYLPDESYIRVMEQSSLISSPASTQLQGLKDKEKAQRKDKEVTSSLAEAMNSVKVALDLHRLNKHDKAARLFQHAIALAPHSPEVLNSYGEFLEESKIDLVEADHMYALAIAFSDDNSDNHFRAIANRKRTAMKVEEIDKHVLSNIDKKKLLFLDIADNSAALRRAKKEAYFQYIFHTVGIEGNTMSLAQTRSILETKLAVAGKSVMEHNEILGMDAALKYINQTLVDKLGDITLQDILEIHKRVIGHVDPVEAGIFRTTQVYVGDHVPPPPSVVEILVARFIDWLNSYEALSLHPVRLAALAHYKLVYIHPFVDGNGRTSRLLMNLVLMQAGFPPVIIRRADREIYYKYLQVANAGDIRPFVRFIAHCTEKTLDAYLWAAREYRASEQDTLDASLPPNLIENSAEEIRGLSGYNNPPPSESFLDFSEAEPTSKIIYSADQFTDDNVIRSS